MTQPVWLFDLDNTLHDASPHIFPHINRSMTAYLAEALGLDTDTASRVRVEYWHRYGATLTGMMRHHGTDPHHFLFHTHQFPQLQRMVLFERALRSMLRRLPGHKIVFSNAPRHYAEAVLRIMGIRNLFDSVWGVEQMRFCPKPAAAGLYRLLHKERLSPARCILVEDSAENLRTAKRLGLKTVLVSRSPGMPAFVDLRIQSVLDLPRKLALLA
jgi:putative hydrolase of the HAD superfamily